jgi:hypothetical protein
MDHIKDDFALVDLDLSLFEVSTLGISAPDPELEVT